MVPFVLVAQTTQAWADPLEPEPDEPTLPAPGAPAPERPEAPPPPEPPPAVPEPTAGDGSTFNYDRLLVTTVQPDEEQWTNDALQLEALLVERFRQRNELVPMSEVPYFDVQGYDGRTYMLGCPPERYAGCALVIGQRTDVERTVGATIRRDPDPEEPSGSLLRASFHIIDVGDGREVVSVTVPIPAGSEDGVVTGVMGLFDEVVRGDYALKEIRQTEGAEQKELDEARKEQIAKALDRLEEKLGTAVMSEDVGIVKRPKVTRADLADYASRDDTPPWERLRMGQGEYLRFANSGDSYADWQVGGWGRTTKVLLRAGVGYGAGPWNQRYVGQVLLSDENLQPLDSAQLLEVTRGNALNFDLEVGFGVLPFLEVDFAAGVRPGESSYLYDEDVRNQIAIPGKESTVGISTWHLGGRLHFAPFPRWPARPTVGLGVARWTGSGIPAQQGFARIDAPTSTFLEVLPGVEVNASAFVVPFARVLVSQPIAGVTLTEVDGGGGLVPAPKPTGDPGGALTVQLGFQVRLGPLVKPKTTTRPL